MDSTAFAANVRNLGATHADLAESHDSIETGMSTLLSIGADADTDETYNDIERRLTDSARSHDTLTDYARAFFGLADIFESDEWRYSDLRLLQQLLDSQPEYDFPDD
jgi:hypothetical protein